MGFLASRKGVAERALVEMGLALCQQFDHRGAPGHGAGLLLDIPWPLLLDRFPEHARLIAQRDVALGMFFLPFESAERRRVVEAIEDLAALGGADVLGWADVPFNVEALPPGSAARRTAPVVRQALFRRPPGLGEDGWFVCRYLLRLALDEVLSETVSDAFAISSLSNRTVVYRGLAQLSRIAELYPDLADPHCASRFVLFHSRYSTNTTTAWRRAQPFWALAHNGEISTIRGNTAWMHAIGQDLVRQLAHRHPTLRRLAARVASVICSGGSDSAALDDMLIALMAGGLSMPQGLLALLPEAPSMARDEPVLAEFHQAMAILLGACDGPAAVVACDGETAVAHLDRNGLRPLWLVTSAHYALAASELTGTVDLGAIESQQIFGPGDIATVQLGSGEVAFTRDVHHALARQRFPQPAPRVVGQSIDRPDAVAVGAGEVRATLLAAVGAAAAPDAELPRLQVAFGMTADDLEVVLAPLAAQGKLAVGAMGDDTPPAALLDALPRRLEDYFKLRFAQETSPPIDCLRDAWVFETEVALGDRSGLWNEAEGPLYTFPHRALDPGELAWLERQPAVEVIDATVPLPASPAALEAALERLLREALAATRRARVVVLSDRAVSSERLALPLLRVVARLHDLVVHEGYRHRVGLVADAGVWDVHHVALLLAVGADAVCPWLGCRSARALGGEGQREREVAKRGGGPAAPRISGPGSVDSPEATVAGVGGDTGAARQAAAAAAERRYLAALRGGLVEVQSMVGVTPASAYCGAKLIEAVGLDADFVARDFPGVPTHLGGIDALTVDAEWLGFHRRAYGAAAIRREGGGEAWAEAPEGTSDEGALGASPRSAIAPAAGAVEVTGRVAAPVEVGEFRYRRDGRPHLHDPEVVRALQAASGFAARGRQAPAEAWKGFRERVAGRPPVTLLDLVTLREAEPIPLAEVEPVEFLLWRLMVPGMSEGALSEPAHRTVARAMNVLHRYCRMRFRRAGVAPPEGIGPFASTGEGGFDKERIGRADGNRSVQYAGGRFTITPATAARADEAEVKFAQGAKPGKGGQLPGRKVSARIAAQRGCLPGYELVSPPVNHNLYSIEDVKLMLESWRQLNPSVSCALKYVATEGVEMVCLGGVNAGANRLHLSDGCGGTGAAKRVDQKHAGVPVVAVLPTVHDLLVEEGVRDRVELSVDGGVQTGEQALELMLLGADRIGLGTSVLVAIGCVMLRQCHMAGPYPDDPTGKRRQGCSMGVATQDPVLVAKFRGRARQITRYLRFLAEEMREGMARLGVRRSAELVGRRDLLVRRGDLVGKAARIDVGHLVSAPPGRAVERRLRRQSELHAPAPRVREEEAADAALAGARVELGGRLTNADRAVGVRLAGRLARARGDRGLAGTGGAVSLRHHGAAGHFYAAYAVSGMDFVLRGVVADSAFTAAYGGRLVVVPDPAAASLRAPSLTLVGNTFAYGARAGTAFLAGAAGNRFAVCLRRSHEGDGPRLVVEGVAANAFQYMTGGTALVLGPVGFNLGAGMTGGVVYLLDPDPEMLNRDYVRADELGGQDVAVVQLLLEEHLQATGSPRAAALREDFDPARFVRVTTRLLPEPLE
jgi:glutamate synthase (ferredoxin)